MDEFCFVRSAGSGVDPWAERKDAWGCSRFLGWFEFVGAFEENGWKLAGTIVPIAYTAWSLWLIITGVVLLAA